MTIAIKTAAHEDLSAAHQRIMDALRANDASTVLTMYADDVVIMPPNDPGVFGKPEAAEWFREYFQHFRITALGEADRDVTMNGEWAIERHGYHVSILPIAGGDRIVDEGRFLMFWKLMNGEWRVAQQIWNSSRPIGSGTSRFMALLKQRLKV